MIYYKKNVINCIMITGKGGREHFAELGIKNFLGQKDSYKKLLIINHGKKSLIDKYPFVNIEEIMTDETNLGKLRNIALEHIEENSLLEYLFMFL